MRVPKIEATVIKINRKMASLTELKDLSKDFKNFRIDSIIAFILILGGIVII